MNDLLIYIFKKTHKSATSRSPILIQRRPCTCPLPAIDAIRCIHHPARCHAQLGDRWRTDRRRGLHGHANCGGDDVGLMVQMLPQSTLQQQGVVRFQPTREDPEVGGRCYGPLSVLLPLLSAERFEPG